MENMLTSKRKETIWDENRKMVSEEKMLENFMNKHLGRKRLLVIRVTTGKDEILSLLHEVSKKKNLKVLHMNEEKLNILHIKALESKKSEAHLIIIDNLAEVKNLDTCEEATVLRGIIDQVDRGNEESILHKDSLFVFLAGEGFPHQEMATVSLTWAHESAFIDCRDFRTKIITHMDDYKKKYLNLHDEIRIKHRIYGHILSEKDYEVNFPVQVRDKLYHSKFLKPIKWNRFSHHLNSSQVMTVNFFYPLIRYKELEAFLTLIGLEDDIIYDPDHLQFLKVSDKDKSLGKKTYFDFYMKLKSGREVFVEIKYTEGVYGKSNSPSYHTKYKEVFEPLLKESVWIKEEFKQEDYFLEHYNFMRGLTHMDENSYLVVIYPRENWAVRERALYIKDHIIEESKQDHFIPLVWEDVIEGVMKRNKDNDVAWYYESWFKDKYFRY